MKKQSILRLIATFMVAVMMLTMLVSCGGKDENTPTIAISDDGYWVINGEKTNVKASYDANNVENPQELAFHLQDDGTYLVSCGNADYLSNIVIPATYKGSAVVGVAEYAFSGCANLTSITFSDSVTSIGKLAFYECVYLTSVTVPDSVTSICDEAFCCCNSLKSIKFEGTVEQWNAIQKNARWKDGSPIKEVVCSDGTVES